MISQDAELLSEFEELLGHRLARRTFNLDLDVFLQGDKLRTACAKQSDQEDTTGLGEEDRRPSFPVKEIGPDEEPASDDRGHSKGVGTEAKGRPSGREKGHEAKVLNVPGRGQQECDHGRIGDGEQT